MSKLQAISSEQMRRVNWRWIGLFVNARRIQQGLSVEELAKRLDIAPRTVKRIEAQQALAKPTLQKILLWSGEKLETALLQGGSERGRIAA